MTSPAFIEIADEAIIPGRTWTDPQTKNTKLLAAKQNAYLHVGKQYPLPFTIDIPEGAAPYRPGRYLFDASSFALGDKNRPELRRYDMALVSIEEVAAFFGGGSEPAKIGKAA